QQAATAESSSTHPLADVVVREASRRGLTPFASQGAVALPGAGVSTRFRDGSDRERLVLVGNRRLMGEHGVAIEAEAEAALEALDSRGETPLLVAIDGRISGLLGVRDQVRPEAHDVIHDLKHLHIKEIAILTGDRASAAKVVAKKTHV